MSALQQFQTGRQTNEAIRMVHVAGFTNLDFDAFEDRISLFDMQCEKATRIPGVHFPSSMTTVDGIRDADLGEFLFNIGSMMK